MPESFRQRFSLALRTLKYGTMALRFNPVEVASITSEDVSEVRSFFPLDKFFIFGHARSGTTMLARAIRIHPEVYCNYQAHFFTRPPLLEALVSNEEVASWLRRGSNRWNRGGDLAPPVLRVAADFILEREARREGKRITGDKSPSSLMDGEAVRKLHKVFPDARLIYIVRDGRDTALSHRFQAFIEFPERLSGDDRRIRQEFENDPQPFLTGQRSIFTEAGLRRAAEGWVRNLIQTDALGKQLYSERYLSLRYEDLLNRPWEEMNRVWSFLDAAPAEPPVREALLDEMRHNPDADWQQQKAGAIAGPLQKGKQGSWRELFTPRDRQIFSETADTALLAWGYEATT